MELLEIEKLDEFSVLCDDCILEIMEMLPLDDLCCLSRTCKRMKALAENCYARKHPKKLKRIIRNFDESLVWSDQTCSPYRPCFDHCVRRIQISFSIINNFHECIVDTLSKAETIAFLICDLGDDIYSSILKHCRQMKHLMIHYNAHCDNNSDLLLRSYTRLEQLQCYNCNKSENDKLIGFLQRNPNVKSLTWDFHFKYDEFDAEDLIQSIVDNGVNLEELFLSIYHYSRLAPICQVLRGLCERKNFKRLELRFYGFAADRMTTKDADELTSLSKLDGLHFHVFENFRELHRSIGALKNLKTLQLNLHYMWEWEFRRFVDELAQSLPNLEQLYYVNVNRYRTFSVKSLFPPFVRYSPKLRKIVMANIYKFEDEMNHIPKFNEERAKLNGARELTLYWEKDVFNMYTSVISDLNAANGLVKIKQISIHNQIFSIKHPFVQIACEEI